MQILLTWNNLALIWSTFFSSSSPVRISFLSSSEVASVTEFFSSLFSLLTSVSALTQVESAFLAARRLNGFEELPVSSPKNLKLKSDSGWFFKMKINKRYFIIISPLSNLAPKPNPFVAFAATFAKGLEDLIYFRKIWKCWVEKMAWNNGLRDVLLVFLNYHQVLPLYLHWLKMIQKIRTLARCHCYWNLFQIKKRSRFRYLFFSADKIKLGLLELSADPEPGFLVFASLQAVEGS